jgi:hypothetical protein
VTGVIDRIRSESDGDFHVRLALDPGQENLLNEKNMSVQHGDLVIGPICEHPATGMCEYWQKIVTLTTPR